MKNKISYTVIATLEYLNEGTLVELKNLVEKERILLIASTIMINSKYHSLNYSRNQLEELNKIIRQVIYNSVEIIDDKFRLQTKFNFKFFDADIDIEIRKIWQDEALSREHILLNFDVEIV